MLLTFVGFTVLELIFNDMKQLKNLSLTCNSASSDRVYCTETRPYNQGARLTAFELVHDAIPASLICDSMAGALMAQGKVTAIITGADRVTANGDTANKIGTYQVIVHC